MGETTHTQTNRLAKATSRYLLQPARLRQLCDDPGRASPSRVSFEIVRMADEESVNRGVAPVVEAMKNKSCSTTGLAVARRPSWKQCYGTRPTIQ